jgi:hypothetical protein
MRSPGAMTLDVAAKIPAILLISVLSALAELVPGGERFLSSLSITAPYNCCLHMFTDLARMRTYFAQWTITSVYRSWPGCWQRTCYNRIGDGLLLLLIIRAGPKLVTLLRACTMLNRLADYKMLHTHVLMYNTYTMRASLPHNAGEVPECPLGITLIRSIKARATYTIASCTLPNFLCSLSQ